MRKSWRTLATTFAFAAATLAATALYADGRHDRSGSVMGQGGMMSMMGQRSGMMDHCRQMMGGGAGRPNEQWRKEAPKTPEKKG